MKKPLKKLMWAGIGLVLAFLVLFVVVGIYVSAHPTKDTVAVPSPATQIVQEQATVAPTQTAQPTNVPAQPVQPTAQPVQPTVAPKQVTPAPVQAEPLLGSNISTFIAAYGQPWSTGQPYAFGHAGTAAKYSVLINGHPDDLVISVVVQSPPTLGWDDNTARAECLLFLPKDAQYQKRFDTAAEGTGYTLLYSSATLASEFTPADFSDAQGNAVTPGTFEVEFVYGDNSMIAASQVAWCTIAIGQQYN